MRKKIGAIIKRERVKWKLSVREFAGLLDIDISEVYKIENGTRNMTVDRLIKICKVLKLKITIK